MKEQVGTKAKAARKNGFKKREELTHSWQILDKSREKLTSLLLGRRINPYMY